MIIVLLNDVLSYAAHIIGFHSQFIAALFFFWFLSPFLPPPTPLSYPNIFLEKHHSNIELLCVYDLSPRQNLTLEVPERNT